MPDTKEQRDKLLQLVREAVQNDLALREKYQVGDKFKFIRDRLNALLAKIEESVASIEKESVQKTHKVEEDEMMVFVHIFNSQGLAFQSWSKMVHQSVFYEYSVNRPIYSEIGHIEAYIRSRPNKVQHAYLSIIIKKSEQLTVPAPGELKDAIGNPLIKIKEGSLKMDRLVSFMHNGVEYIVDANGEIVKKTV